MPHIKVYSPLLLALCVVLPATLPVRGSCQTLPTFYAPDATLFAPAIYQQGLAAGDFNNDGKMDFVVFTTAGFDIYLGKEDGTLQPPLTTTVPFVPNPFAGAAGDVNGDRTTDIVVASGGLIYTYLSNGDGTFKSPVSSPTVNAGDSGPLSLADFNGDGKLDAAFLASSAQGTSAGVAVMFGNGDGTFQPAVLLGSTPNCCLVYATGDFNGDGRGDIFLATYNNNSLITSATVFLANGDNTFKSATTTFSPALPFAPFTPWVIAADFSGDGKDDIALGTPVSILLSNGDGTFQSPATLPNSSGFEPAAAGDFNGDGKQDLLTVRAQSSLAPVALKLFLGNGDGTFQPPEAPFGAEYPANGVFVGVGSANSGILPIDFNADGKLDLVFMEGTNQLSLVAGNRDGTFRVPPFVTAPLPPEENIAAIATGDFNGDGKPDLVQVAALPGAVTVLLNTGTGFSPAIVTAPINYEGYSSPAVLADFNGDGKLDLAQGESVLLGNGDGTFQPETHFQMQAAAAADFNGDGRVDLIGFSSNQLSVEYGNGDGTFAFPVQISVNAAIQNSGGAIAVGDFNKDGKPDLGWATGDQSGQPIVSVFINAGNGSFSEADYAVSGQASEAILLGDFDGDGNLDIAALTSEPFNVGVLNVFLGNANGTFQTAITSRIPYAGPMVAADYNLDGKLDLAVNEGSCVIILLGNGDGTFTQGPCFATEGGNSLTLLTADFNGDGAPDLATGGFSLLINTIKGATPSAASANILPSTLTFTTQAGTISSAQNVTISNAGLLPLRIDSIEIGGAQAGEFRQSNNCPINLTSGSNCTVAVQFAPAQPGNASAIMTITDNSGAGSQTVAVSGSAVNLGLKAASGASTSVTVTAGNQATYNLSIGGTGMSGQTTLTCTGAPKGATCTISPASLNVSASSASSLTVTVTTTSRTMAFASPERTIRYSWLWATGIFGLLFIGAGRNRKKKIRVGGILSMLLLCLLCACGGSSSGGSSGGTNPNGTPAGTYQLAVTATSGGTTESLPLTLVVQ